MTTAEHPAGRLSAYADDELPADERATVEAHLRECAACRDELEELLAVDEAARALPVQAPAGYFDAFPARVTGRLAARRRRSVPAWTWAAAAAVLLAVLTPLTLRERAGDARVADRIAAPAPAEERARPAPRQVPEEQSPSIPEAAATPERKGLGYAPPTSPPARRRDEPVLAKREAPARLAARDTVVEERPAAQRAAPGKEAAQAETAAETAVGGAEERDAAAAPPPPPRPAARGHAAGGRTMAEGARAQSGTGSPAPTSAPGPVASGAESEGRVFLKSARLKSRPSEDLASLAARPQRTAAEARAAAHAYRAYAQRHPGTSDADEARVRAIEALAAAWQMERRPADRDEARAEARAYLAGDGRLRDRVRGVLAGLAN